MKFFPKIKSKIFFTFLAVLFLIFNFCFLISANNVYATGASFYLSPNSGTFYVGNTFDVSIFVNTGSNNINAIQADLKFDPKKLQIASPTAGKSFISVWVAQPAYSNSEGTASFQGGMPSPGINTSAGLVSTITFRAVSPGNTTIYFQDTSKILLDDGKGTNVLSSMGRGVYSLTIPPPEGPEVFSPTHSDQNKWYKNNNPTFAWVKGEGVAEFSYSIDNDPQGIPDNNSEGDIDSVSYSNLADGIFYFHIKAKKANVWGGISHYLVQIDATPPASFLPNASPAEKTTTKNPIISFITTDALSGFDHFETKIIDITPGRQEKETAFFMETASPYKLPELSVGKYLIVVRAFDAAGNWQDETLQIQIIPAGIYITREGIFFWGFFLPWWLISLIIFLILVSVIWILLGINRKKKKKQNELKIRLIKKQEEIQKQEEELKGLK
ncbi:MAG: cohesin domain-containing protein [Candidatus Pacebacteria bacterium]|nr:cohesin domain-containing protein [Candidatus Paceibacterota bacterium]